MINIRRSMVLGGIALAFGAVILLNACKHEPGVAPYTGSGYPAEIARIMVSKCAVDGCHNSQSYENSAGVLLDTWDHLFNGSTHGAVVIPYDIENSSLLYFINTDSTLGHVQLPTMPEGGAPLTREEYLTIRGWIGVGAPDVNGKVAFSDNRDTRQKVYLTAQGCDLLHVIDADRKVIMRNIKLGNKPDIESPHCVRVSKDGRYAYVCFFNSDSVQKIDTRTDAVVGAALVNLGGTSSTPQYNILHVSDDGSKVVAADFNNGLLRFIETASMKVTSSIQGSNLFHLPHGIAANAAFDTLYITAQQGNTVYKISPNGYYKKVTIDGNPQNYTLGTRDPHEIMLTPDGSKYFLTCEASNEVRVMDAHADTLIAVFSTPKKPQELAISTSKKYMIVTCMEAPQGDPKKLGALVVINYETMQLVGQPIYGDFYQPHGVAVDDNAKLFYVASTNGNPTGPAPHHASSCGGRNGWYSVYSLETLQPVDNIKYETSVMPYSADIRFKKD